MKDHYGCPIQATANLISGKWKVLVLWYLSFQSYRFSELRNLLESVSEKVLAAQLRELEDDGLVLRRDWHTVPPRVEYSLSDAGERLMPIMNQMGSWAAEHLGMVPAPFLVKATGAPSTRVISMRTDELASPITH